MADQATPKSLSVIIPVYNELDTWKELLARVEAVEIPGVRKQIILVEDGSGDGTREQLAQFARRLEPPQPPLRAGGAEIKVLFHRQNQGKGAALRTGFAAAEGDFVIVQDADLEYDPHDYPKLLQPLIDGRADAVYGSRFARGRPADTYFKNYLANRILTWLSNRTTGLKLTDMETCYKVFKRELIQQVRIEQNRFGFEPEVTAKIAALGASVVELPISYSGRTRAEGKKIGWKDGLRAIWCILKYCPPRPRRGR